MSDCIAKVSCTFALKLFFLISILLSVVPAFVLGNHFSLRDFQGFQTTIYSNSSGFPFLQVYYRSAVSEKPKLGFLKFGFSFLKIQDLQLKIDARHGSKSLILDLFHEVCSTRGVRYATVETISIQIKSDEQNSFKFHASNGKFTSQQSLKLWGDVLYSNDDEEKQFKSISFTPHLKFNSLLCSFDNGKKTMPILFSGKATN